MKDKDDGYESEDIGDIDDTEFTAADAENADADGEDGADGADGADAQGADAADDDGDGAYAEDSELGKRAQKRIGRLIAERKEAVSRLAAVKAELEQAKRLGGDDGKAILAAAEKSGILPGLMSADEARAFGVLEEYPAVIEGYRDWLDEHGVGDELEVGGRTMTYGEVKKRVRRLTDELGAAKDDYGERRKVLQRKVRKIFQLGLEAYRRGGAADGKVDKGGDDAKKGRVKPHERPNGPKPKAEATGRTNWGSVKSDRDFVAMIAAQNKRKEGD